MINHGTRLSIVFELNEEVPELRRAENKEKNKTPCSVIKFAERDSSEKSECVKMKAWHLYSMNSSFMSRGR